MKKIILFINLFIYSSLCLGQGLTVSSFKLLDTDLTASTRETSKKDQNGEVAALIKIVTTETGFTFDGGQLGIVKSIQTPGEIWLYVPRRSQKLTIKHPQLGILRDYIYPISIEGARTYELVLASGIVQTIVKKSRSNQYVVFQVSPSTAIVELNGDLLPVVEGSASKMMKFGTYNYRIQAPNYIPYEGVVTVDNPKEKHIITVDLKPNFSDVNLFVDIDAEIWINGEKKGFKSWSGTLGAGTYEIETRKKGYRSAITTCDISASSNSRTIVLDSPTPIYGEADINSTPGLADIYVDGQKMGQTPLVISQLIIGEHDIRISRQGYNDFNGKIYIEENETSPLSILLNKKVSNQNQLFSDNSNNQSRRVIKVGSTSFTLIQVKGGTFTMGATEEQGEDYYKDELPLHRVTLEDYYIGETEVTQELWEKITDYNPSRVIDKDHPVEQVKYDECLHFIEKLNSLTGLNFRLPTEAEWEYAARGGQKSLGYKYSGSNDIDEVAWHKDNSSGYTHNAKWKKPNELGIYGMSGNVYEFCSDMKFPYSSNDQISPSFYIFPSSGNRVIRGGAYTEDSKNCRVSYREEFGGEGNQSCSIGFRLVLPGH